MFRHSSITKLILILNVFTAVICVNTVPVAAAPTSETGATLLLVATADTYSGAGQFTDFLEKKSVPYRHISPLQFEHHSSARHIVMIVGVNEGGVTDDIVSRVMDKEEWTWLSEPGNNGIYMKQDVWTDNQNVMVIAGSSPETAIDGFDYFRDQWLSSLASWFGFSLSSEELYGY